MTRWDPERYERFRNERAIPFHDLLARVPDDDVRRVADLGCGSAGLTRELAVRWPSAEIWGVDSSQEMLDHADDLPANLRLICEDLRTWTPPGLALDRIISNAALQWVPDHASLLGRITGWLAPGGVLAVQVPNNRAQPIYQRLDQLLAAPPWDELLAEVQQPRVEAPGWYHQKLSALGLQVVLWETVYYHQLGTPGVEGVISWLEGTTLRPVLSRLDANQTGAFLDALRSRAATDYSGEGLFPFRRLFFVARLPRTE